jgi:hypothetical protein
MTILSDRVIPSDPAPSAPPAKKKRSLGAAVEAHLVLPREARELLLPVPLHRRVHRPDF